MFAWLESLNDEQRAAATFEGGALRIVAGAGTGKTTTLTSRVAWLVGSGVPAERILLLTFTRRAAREMVARTTALLEQDGGRGGRRPARVLGGTFHSVAHRTLRRHATALGLPDGFSVLDTSDAADVIDLVRQELNPTVPDRRRFPRKATLLDLYSRSVNTQRPLSAVIDEVAPWCVDLVEPIAAICRGYVERKRTLGLLDFDDLLLYWRAAAADERLGATLGGELEHICVDEYQDVNALQVDIVAELRRRDDRVTVVGDDSQAVYGFRGASPQHLLRIDERFPGIATIALGRNYRSTQVILDVANAVSDDAPAGFLARLHAVPDPNAAVTAGTAATTVDVGLASLLGPIGIELDPTGPKGSAASAAVGARPRLVHCADEDAQVEAVCTQVLTHREEGLRLQDQAVLVRAAHHSALLELELSRRRIPYVKYGGLRYLEAAHVKDLVCLFRLADNPRDELSWFRLLQLVEGVGPVSARRAIEALGVDQPGTPAEVLLRWPLALDELPTGSREPAAALVRGLRREPDEPLAAQAERLRAALAPLIERAYENGPARVTDLDALVVAAHDAARLSDVAADLTLEPPASTGDLAGPPLVDEDWLVISTVHSAKGLEWDVAHILNASDGNFPSDMALASLEGLEEERRLFYVAVTRPRRALHVYVPLRYHHRPRGRDDAHTYGQPSRFLSDRVAACFDADRATHTERHDVAREPVIDAAVQVGVALDALWA